MSKPVFTGINEAGLLRLAMAENGAVRLSGESETDEGFYMALDVKDDVTFDDLTEVYNGDAPAEDEVWPVGVHLMPFRKIRLKSGLAYAVKLKDAQV